MMTQSEFIVLVKEMRYWQKEYFRRRKAGLDAGTELQMSKKAEELVDKTISDYMSNQYQLNLD